MKTRHVFFAPLLFGIFAALPAVAARDPFWPIGYEPPKPEPAAAAGEPVVKNTEPPPPPKPVEKAITEADWAVARKALVISGFTQTVMPDTQEKRVLAMVNRHMVAVGDTVTFDHKDVRYIWRVESMTDNRIQLEPLKAERVALKPTDLIQ